VPIELEKTLSSLETNWYSILDPSALPSEHYEPGYVRDPIHGHIKLTPPDFFILDMPPFQRLRAVLSLALWIGFTLELTTADSSILSELHTSQKE
jgi:hypothetical protein